MSTGLKLVPTSVRPKKKPRIVSRNGELMSWVNSIAVEKQNAAPVMIKGFLFGEMNINKKKKNMV